MATIDSAVCSTDLIGQCEIALEAIGNLNYALMNLYQVPSGGSRYDIFKEEVFEMIYTFLDHAACISWMIWPDTEGKNGLYHGRFTEAEEHQGRGSFPQSTLQRMPGTSKTRLLKILKRLYPSPLTLKDGMSGPFISPDTLHIIGSAIAVTGQPSLKGLRIYDPTTRDFHMDGEIYPLQEIAATIALLRACARGEGKKPLRISPTLSRRHFNDSRGIGRKAVHL